MTRMSFCILLNYLCNSFVTKVVTKVIIKRIRKYVSRAIKSVYLMRWADKQPASQARPTSQPVRHQEQQHHQQQQLLLLPSSGTKFMLKMKPKATLLLGFFFANNVRGFVYGSLYGRQQQQQQ